MSGTWYGAALCYFGDLEIAVPSSEVMVPCLPAEPAFPCGDDNSNSSSNSSNSNTSRFGLGVFRAGGGPAGSALVWGFSRPAAVRPSSRYAVTYIRTFQWYAVTDIRAVSAGSSGFGL